MVVSERVYIETERAARFAGHAGEVACVGGSPPTPSIDEVLR